MSRTARRVLDLANGQPCVGELPTELVRAAAAAALDAPPAADTSGCLSYGDDVGLFQRAVSRLLQRSCGLAEAPAAERFWPTGGVSQALAQACALLRGDVVLVEDPTYFLSITLFRSRGFEVVGVECDGGGADVSALAREAERQAAAGKTVAAFYCVPTFHNPTGRTMDAERRAAVVAACADRGIPVIADEVYLLLHWDGCQPPPRMSTFGSNVISLGSFSKVLAPGLRVGWVESIDHLSKFQNDPLVMSGGCVSHFSSLVVAQAITTGSLEPHIRALSSVYSERCKALCAALREHLPPGCAFEEPKGGYFVWVSLPEGVSASAVAAAVSDDEDGDRVVFHTGDNFSPSGRFGGCMRLCFARLAAADLVAAARVLGRVIAGVQQR